MRVMNVHSFFSVVVISMALITLPGCGGGGGGDSSTTTTTPPVDMTSHMVSLGTATFETNVNLPASSRNFSNNNSNLYHGSSFTMAGFGARVGQTLAISFTSNTIDSVPTIQMSMNFGGGTVETYDIACGTDGALYNLQAAGRTGNNFTITGNATTPPIFLPATITNGATWSGGFTQSDAMSIISVSATGPASGAPGEIHFRKASSGGSPQLEYYIKVGFGLTDITTNTDVDGYKTNLTSSG